MVTQKDIAAACGVSTAAVSRALNDHSDISEETKEMIRRTAEKLGYKAGAFEKMKRNHHRIGLLVTGDAETWFHACVIMEIRHILMERGYDLVLLSPFARGGGQGLSPEYEEEADISRIPAFIQPGYLARVRAMELDGIFLFSSICDSQLLMMKEYADLRELISGGIHVVPVDCRISTCTSVMPDYETGIRSLLKYALELGHWRIAAVYGKDGEKSSVIERTISQLGRSLRFRVRPEHTFHVKAECAQESYDATLSILKDSKWIRPTCILYGDDFLLEGGRAAIRSQGLRIPEDVSIASMSFADARATWNRGLTSWQLQPARIAEEAVRTMLVAIARGRTEAGQVNKVAGSMNCGETLTDLWQEAPSARVRQHRPDLEDPGLPSSF